MAALLTSTPDNKDRLAIYLAECRHMDITVLPPDVNSSVATFTPVGDDIRFGLAAVRNVGTQVVDAIVATREEAGAYTSFGDFMSKVPAPVCNKRAIESLIKAGAFDSLGHARRALLTVHEDAVDEVIAIKRNEAMGQFDLFSSDPEPARLTTEIPDLPEWEKRDKLAFEREMLGLYVSDHPLAGLEHLLARSSDISIGALKQDGAREGEVVTVAGLVTSMTRKITKAGKPWAIATVEDLSGETEVTFFPKVYQDVSVVLAEDLLVSLRARVQVREDTTSLNAIELRTIDATAVRAAPVTIQIAEQRCTVPMIEQVADVLSSHGGNVPVFLSVTGRRGRRRVALADRFRVDPGPALFGDLKALLGPGCLVD